MTSIIMKSMFKFTYFIKYPIINDKRPSPNAAHSIKLEFCSGEISKLCYPGIDKNNGNIDDKLAPKVTALKLHAYPIYPNSINPKVSIEKIIWA